MTAPDVISMTIKSLLTPKFDLAFQKILFNSPNIPHMREDTHTITVGHLYTSLETFPLLPTMFEGYGWEYLYFN